MFKTGDWLWYSEQNTMFYIYDQTEDLLTFMYYYTEDDVVVIQGGWEKVFMEGYKTYSTSEVEDSAWRLIKMLFEKGLENYN